MNWRQIYRQRLCTAEQAVSHIKSGDWVVIAHAAGEPAHVVAAMVKNRQAYRNVEIFHMVPMGDMAYAQPGMEAHFVHNTIFAGAKSRDTIRNGHGDYITCYFSEVHQLFAGERRPDVALIHVSPPDEHGFCSLGVAVDYTKPAAERARMIIAQVNPQMPRTLGDCFLHVSAFDHIVEHDEPVIELTPPALGEVEKAIGAHCASLIRDGDCLQLGIGAIPDAVLLSLKDKKHLGIHSEMFSDGVVELAEGGVIDHKRKNFHPGVAVATFLMGSRRLYDYVDNNPAVNMYPAWYVNDPRIAGQNDNLVSINSCVEIDLMGQVCADMVGPMQISGVGGQVDFVRAAAFSRGGRSVIAIASTARHGSVSKIVPALAEGACITTCRYDVDYVVSEYGIAHLKHRTVRERARSLIEIAHPAFRDMLKEAYFQRFHVKP